MPEIKETDGAFSKAARTAADVAAGVRPAGARRRGCAVAALLASGISILAFMGWMAYSARIPLDSPLARMYRTEVDLAALARAISQYHAKNDAYPAPGPEGLRKAAESLSEKARYYAGALPLDGWGRPFIYVPHTAYGAPESGALKREDGAPESGALRREDGAPESGALRREDGAPESGALRRENGAPYAPGTFQLYSTGADGLAGLENPGERSDNIASWDPVRSWRMTYHDLQRAYKKRGDDRP